MPKKTPQLHDPINISTEIKNDVPVSSENIPTIFPDQENQNNNEIKQYGTSETNEVNEEGLEKRLRYASIIISIIASLVTVVYCLWNMHIWPFNRHIELSNTGVISEYKPTITYAESHGLKNIIIDGSSFTVFGSGLKNFKRVEMTHSSMNEARTIHVGNYNGVISDDMITFNFTYAYNDPRNYTESYSLRVVTIGQSGEEIFSNSIIVYVQDNKLAEDSEYHAIELDSPNGGETLKRGKKYYINYSLTDYPRLYIIRLKLFKGGLFVTELESPGGPMSSGPYGTAVGTYHWIVPMNMPIGSDYKMQASLYKPDGMSLISQDISSSTFSIVSE